MKKLTIILTMLLSFNIKTVKAQYNTWNTTNAHQNSDVAKITARNNIEALNNDDRGQWVEYTRTFQSGVNKRFRWEVSNKTIMIDGSTNSNIRGSYQQRKYEKFPEIYWADFKALKTELKSGILKECARITNIYGMDYGYYCKINDEILKRQTFHLLHHLDFVRNLSNMPNGADFEKKYMSHVYTRYAIMQIVTQTEIAAGGVSANQTVNFANSNKKTTISEVENIALSMSYINGGEYGHYTYHNYHKIKGYNVIEKYQRQIHQLEQPVLTTGKVEMKLNDYNVKKLDLRELFLHSLFAASEYETFIRSLAREVNINGFHMVMQLTHEPILTVNEQHYFDDADMEKMFKEIKANQE